MASIGDAYENAVLDSILGDDHASMFPATVYVALFTDWPDDSAAAATEVSGGSYTRVAVDNDDINWPQATGGAKSNGSVITFPTATAAWGYITHVALMDDTWPDGDAVLHAALDDPVAVDTGDTFELQPGALTWTAD